jgi:dTDP-4-amino-4,6-dideoxygalactose transaminase
MNVFQTQLSNKDIEKINLVLKEGTLGFGSNVIKFEDSFCSFSNKKYNIATNSASAAAFMIFAYLKEMYGTCDVYTTSLGFTSPAWAAKHFQHNLYFVDVDDNLMFSSLHYKETRRESKNPVVVMPVLYGGVSTIEGFELCGDEIVVVDSAHCVTPTIPCDYSFFSFHPYKPICTSDGGAIATDNEEASNYFKKYRNFGRLSAKNTYNIIQEGFKFYMNNLNATIGLTQLPQYQENLQIRKENYDKLVERYDLLSHDINSSYYFATAITDEADAVLEENNLSRHYPMLHQTEYYQSNQSLPNLEKIHSKILNLPLYCEFTLT